MASFLNRLKSLARDIARWLGLSEAQSSPRMIPAQSEAHSSLESLFRQYNIEPPHVPPEPETRRIDGFELIEQLRQKDGRAADAVELREQAAAQKIVQLDEFIQVADEKGTPGIPVTGGLPRAEDSAKYRPYEVRGYASQPGLLENYYRQDPVFRDSVDAITEIQVSATREVQTPNRMPDDERVADELREWTEWVDGKLANLPGGLERYYFQATHSAAIFGFAIHEIVWARDRRTGRMWPHKLAYREPATVQRWIQTERGDQLAAVEFQVGGEQSRNYALSASGVRLSDYQVLLARVAGRGNNWEGVAPGRPAFHWVKFKQLLGQIAAATAQKYGVPTTYITRDPSFDPSVGAGAAADDKVDTQVHLAAKQAVEAAVVVLPDGIQTKLESPTGTMPSFQELISYCDEQIARPFSNEGSLLGHNQVGSYALADVQDNKFMRSAPYYDRIISEPINDLIRLMAKREFGELPAYPRLKTSWHAMHDTTGWISDITKLFPNMALTDYPSGVQDAVLEKMSLPEDALEPDEHEDEAGQPVEAVELAEQHATFVALQETVRADEVQKFMDQTESALARSLNSIAERQRKVFRDATQGITDADRLQQLADEVKEQFQPEYVEAVREAAGKLTDRGAREMLREQGFTVARDASMPTPSGSTRAQLEATIAATAEEVNARNVGYMRDQRIQQISGETDASVQKIKKSTIAGVTNRIGGRAFNAGRQSVVDEATDLVERQTGNKIQDREGPGPTITAVRSSVLDDNVCDRCLQLDFEMGGPTYIVGSNRFRQDFPPEPCEGGEFCRCTMIYSMPSESRTALESIARGEPLAIAGGG